MSTSTPPMRGFSGFRGGKVRITPIPNQFFAELLPIIDHLGELKVTLYFFWALKRKEGKIRYILAREMLADDLLMEALGHPRRVAEEVLWDSLERAEARGTILHVSVESAAGSDDLYFLNTPKGRAAVEAITRGEWRPGDYDHPVELTTERPNIFTVYEQNIGPLTPIIADELRDAEETYGPKAIEEAIKTAVKNNVRRWSYVLGVLQRMAEGDTGGKVRGDSKKDRHHIDDEFADIIRT